MYGDAMMFYNGLFYPSFISDCSSGGGVLNGIPPGGQAGSVLVKQSDQDYDAIFENPYQTKVIDISDKSKVICEGGTFNSSRYVIYYNKLITYIAFMINDYTHGNNLVARFKLSVDNLLKDSDKFTYNITGLAILANNHSNYRNFTIKTVPSTNSIFIETWDETTVLKNIKYINATFFIPNRLIE